MIKNHRLEPETCRKLNAKYIGPYRVKKVHDNNCVELEDMDQNTKATRFNVQEVRQVISRRPDLDPILEEETDHELSHHSSGPANPDHDDEIANASRPHASDHVDDSWDVVDRSELEERDPVRKSSRERRQKQRLITKM